MDRIKAQAFHSLVWAVVAIVAIVTISVTTAYVYHDDNVTKVKLKDK